MLSFILFYVIICLSSCQMNWNQWQNRPQPFLSDRRRFIGTPSQRRLPNTAVANAVPSIRWNEPIKEIQPEPSDAKASESVIFKNGASIFAGNMSKEFLKEISDYIYGLISGKLSTPKHRKRSRILRVGRRSNEILDYEDEARTIDAQERALAQRRSMAVVQAPSRTAIPLVVRSRPRIGISRRKLTNSLRDVHSFSSTSNRTNKRLFRSGGVA